MAYSKDAKRERSLEISNNTRGLKTRVKPKTKWSKLFYRDVGFDMPFFIICMLLLTIGLIMMFSASYAYAYYDYGDGLFFIKSQLKFAVIGVALMLFISTIDYKYMRIISLVAMPVSIILLVVALVLPGVNGVHRWIRVPFIGQFQPSEVAKFAVIALFANLISLNHKKMPTFKSGVLPYFAILIVIAGLLVLQPHYSATIIIVALGLIMMFVGGANLKFLIPLLIIGGVGVAVLVMTPLVPYVQQKMVSWLHPETDLQGAGWQIMQSLYAIASGGAFGVGIGNSRQKYGFVSQPQNDFVFSIVCEELGFVGATVIIILFVILVWRGCVIAMRAKDKFGTLLAVGFIIQVGLQAALNIAVVTNLIPNTGISLPFFSSGGSSLIMLLCEMGIILSVSRQSVMAKK